MVDDQCISGSKESILPRFCIITPQAFQQAFLTRDDEPSVWFSTMKTGGWLLGCTIKVLIICAVRLHDLLLWGSRRHNAAESFALDAFMGNQYATDLPGPADEPEVSAIE